VVGFLFEELHRNYASIGGLEACREALQELHRLGIIHCDINKYNNFMTADRPKFIDFEDSILESGGKAKTSNLEKLEAKEIESLSSKLLDNSGKGRPWKKK
jgi:RIO-like serine/threonine protein kinase